MTTTSDHFHERTYREFTEGVDWNIRYLGVPRLPYTFPVFQKGLRSDLDTPARPAMLRRIDDPSVSISPYYRSPDQFLEDHFSDDGLYIEDMPIKVPGGPIVIPNEVFHNHFEHFLRWWLVHEQVLNPHYDSQYLYLTIQQSWVKAGAVQRRPGMHLDGFQKAGIVPQPAQHQFAITNAVPTQFVAHFFDFENLPRDKKGMFEKLQQESEGKSRWTAKPYQMHLLNAFCPHEPGVAKYDCFRTFIRCSGSTIPFMGSDNTRNPFLNLEWNVESKRKYYESIVLPEAS